MLNTGDISLLGDHWRFLGLYAKLRSCSGEGKQQLDPNEKKPPKRLGKERQGGFVHRQEQAYAP
ncbi:hypothetical protein D3C85_1908230 [compost metagenome]